MPRLLYVLLVVLVVLLIAILFVTHVRLTVH